MKFQFKITTWEEVTVPEYLEGQVLEAVESGKIESAQDVFDWLSENGHEVDAECSKIDDVDEQMTVEENGGQSTIEVLDDGKYIFHNGEL
jgi:hypothetical protein